MKTMGKFRKLSKQQIESVVKRIVVEQLGYDACAVTPEASFYDDLGCDSLDRIELLMAIEEEFGIEIPDDKAEEMHLVKQAIAYVEGLCLAT